MYQFNEFPKHAEDYSESYARFKKTSLATFNAAFDPASTRVDLTSALKQMEGFPPYDLYSGEYNVTVDELLFEQELQLHLYTEFGNEPGQWTEANAEKLMNKIALVRDDLFPLISWDGWKPAVWHIFWDYLNAMADFEDLRNGRTELLEQTFQYRTDVLNRIADGRLTSQQAASFDAAVQELETLLATSAQPEPITSAFAKVKAAYEALPQGGSSSSALAADIAAARELLNLPKGIRSGQYPASAFGDLRRAINEASLVLNRKSSTSAQLEQARTKLVAAVAQFHSRKKP
ncbi:hypothetical protein QWJ34_19485 [Saccharibacillus sp. CPCC 101409]|uniref:hypothetical protein n=1 Tax=Saccharibacillus sp. CPCC 101409 TaxID=3058041 RepID=UPI002673E14C|nr:hypothetical protein [Saccharibacillus sp. CPCC 101409]MDO3411954.1 hypothetical protein [Saccharibacillus sp. CPCC 101409]